MAKNVKKFFDWANEHNKTIKKKDKNLSDIKKQNAKTPQKDIPANKKKKSSKELINALEYKYARKISRIDEIDSKQHCNYCGTITGKDFFIFRFDKEIKLCRKCYQSLPRCHNCRLPVKNPISGLKEQYCQYCKTGVKCYSCQIKISKDNRIRIPGIRGVFCKECLTKNHCDFCHRPISSRHKENIINICSICANWSITEESHAQNISKKILGLINSHLGYTKGLYINIKFFTPEILLNKGISMDWRLTPIIKTNNVLLVLKGLPEKNFYTFLLFHYANDILAKIPVKMPLPYYREGFKLFFARLILDKMHLVEYALQIDHTNIEAKKGSFYYERWAEKSGKENIIPLIQKGIYLDI